MSNRELIFGPANFREEEATETAAKLLDLQRLAEKMVSRDKRFDVFDAQKNNPPSLAWSDDSEDGNLRVYAIAKYGRARGKRMKTEQIIVGYARDTGETREIEFSSAVPKSKETLLIKNEPNISSTVNEIHEAFKEVYGYDENRPMSLL